MTRVEDEVITHFYYTGSALLFTTVNEYVLQTQNILDPSGTIVASKRFEGQAETEQDPYADDYFFYRYDICGSVTNIVDGAGCVVKSYDYDEFGVTTSMGDTFFNEVTFTGSVADASGLLYMNARYYNPATARFLSQDTYTGSASVPWTQHLYAYCNNNPVNLVDPTGHSAWLVVILIALVTAATTGCSNQPPEPEPTEEPEPTPVRMQVVPDPSPAPAQIPPSSWGNTDIPAIIAKRNNASDSAIKMIDKAAEYLGAPYQCPPKDEGTYDCASLVRAAARTIDTKFRGGSCKKQRNYIAGLYSENPNPPWFFTSGTELQRDMLFMIPGDLIYWESSTNPSHGHVAIYLGEGYILDATESGGGVAYRQYTDYVNANPQAAYVGYARYSGN